LSFEDDVSDLLYTPGEFCYTIKANETPGFNIAFNSFSNQRCITQEPKIWVPNSFVVGGFNNTFQPVISFADFERYEMYIFNRWGDLVYETDLIEEGWNGAAKGKEDGETLMEGVYTYFIKVQDGAGRVYERRGTLTLLNGKE
jgi:gliding motility-associated-like protein